MLIMICGIGLLLKRSNKMYNPQLKATALNVVAFFQIIGIRCKSKFMYFILTPL